MDKIGSSSRLGNIATSQIPQTETSQPATDTSTKTSGGESNTATSTKSEQQEATSRKNESSLQATVRKEGLLKEAGQGKVDEKSVGGAKFVERTLPSDSEVREMVLKKAFPAVKQGMEKAGLSINDRTCHIASALMKTALEKQGFKNVTIKEGPQHAYVEIQTKKGTLIIDPTASQFLKDGNPVDTKLQNEGFVGTKQELKKLVNDNLERWKFDNLVPDPAAFDAARGKKEPGVTNKMVEDHISQLQSEAQRTYFGDGKQMGKMANSIVERIKNNELDKPLVVGTYEQVGEGSLMIPSQKDIGPTIKEAYEAMSRILAE